MYGNDKEDRWKNLREKIEPPQTTRNDRIRLVILGALKIKIYPIFFACPGLLGSSA